MWRTKSKRGVGLKKVYILPSGAVCLLNTHGLSLEKGPDLAKIHSNSSGAREKNKQTNKKYIHVVGKKSLRTWCWWETRLKIYARTTQVLLMFDQLLLYYASCYRCSYNLCNRMFKKIKEKL